jgi:gliding motility-associated-like protein
LAGAIYELLDARTGQLIQNNNSGTFNITNVKEDMIFAVRASAGPCVSAVGQVIIKVIDVTQLEIPNAFSPNGDGINDHFKIRVTGYFKSDGLKIFNRWGQLIFETKDLGNEWDGTIKGNPLPIGTYYWVIEGIDVEGKRLRKSGSVTLVR